MFGRHELSPEHLFVKTFATRTASGTDRVSDALLGEAGLGGAVQLLVLGLAVARLGGIALALLHEARHCRTSEFLVRRHALAGIVGESRCREASDKKRKESRFHE